MNGVGFTIAIAGDAYDNWVGTKECAAPKDAVVLGQQLDEMIIHSRGQKETA